MSRVKLFRNASLAALGFAFAVPAAMALAQEAPKPAEAAKAEDSTPENRSERRVQRLLERYDANKDGLLDAEELAAIGNRRGGEDRGFRRGGRHHEMRGHRQGPRAQHARWNRGGHAGPRGPRWGSPEMRGNMLDRMFERLDADKDGTVTREELEAHKTAMAERHEQRLERRKERRTEHRAERRSGRAPAVTLEGGVTLEELAEAIEKLRAERAAQ